jgi:divalent metal cation (Fe/Co/Zn/Cd) transporter
MAADCRGSGGRKQRIGERLGSRATYGEGTQNVLCAILAGAVLVGLAVNTLLGLWWVDPAIALAIAQLASAKVRELGAGKSAGVPRALNSPSP